MEGGLAYIEVTRRKCGVSSVTPYLFTFTNSFEDILRSRGNVAQYSSEIIA
jgi:hypothetical protein